VQSVTITTKVLSSNVSHGEVYSTLHYATKFVSNPASFTNKTAPHDIPEILLKMALNTINQQTNQSRINKTINHL
jgi:hypothetical protein